VVVVASAGNSGKRRTAFDNVGYPAAYPEVIAVGAIDSSDTRATFSSTGPDLDVMAPGVSVWSTYVDGQWRSMSGTSMACPHVAGTVALVLAFATTPTDGWTPKNMHAYINTTVEDMGSVGWDNAYGYGIINADLAVNG
jgi:subtilisin family serine protease